jgi:hypothetical protein
MRYALVGQRKGDDGGRYLSSQSKQMQTRAWQMYRAGELPHVYRVREDGTPAGKLSEYDSTVTQRVIKEILRTKKALGKNPRRNRKRKRGKNPSRYQGRNVYKMTAQRPGGKVLTLVQGNKFAERGKPVHFADHASAWATAKWLQDQFPTLRRYTILVTSR